MERPKFAPGYESMLMGWKVRIQTERHISLECGVHKDIATLVTNVKEMAAVAEITVEYEKPEMVPKPVRTWIKILFRKVVAQSLQSKLA